MRINNVIQDAFDWVKSWALVKRKAMTPERINEIVDCLRGTGNSIADCLDPGEDADDEELLVAIDTEIFECEQCNWWCERCEESEVIEGVCTDCV